MTPIGHSLTGIVICYAVLPERFPAQAKAIAFGAFIILASAPDLPFPNWGHDRYDISHSVFVTTIAASIVALLARWMLKKRAYYSPALIASGIGAWFSHLLLDTFYNHGQGLAMFWPMSKARIALPFPFFETMDTLHLLSLHNAKVFTIEGIFYGAILLVVVMMKKFMFTRRNFAKAS